VSNLRLLVAIVNGRMGSTNNKMGIFGGGIAKVGHEDLAHWLFCGSLSGSVIGRQARRDVRETLSHIY
jgi:hypothetical protein